MDKYVRGDKADLSGMTPGQLSEYLQPKYDGDVDWWDDIKFGFGVPLLVIVLLGCIAAIAIGIIGWIL